MLHCTFSSWLNTMTLVFLTSSRYNAIIITISCLYYSQVKPFDHTTSVSQDSNDKPNKLPRRTATRSQTRPVCNNGITQFDLPPTHEPCVSVHVKFLTWMNSDTRKADDRWRVNWHFSIVSLHLCKENSAVVKTDTDYSRLIILLQMSALYLSIAILTFHFIFTADSSTRRLRWQYFEF